MGRKYGFRSGVVTSYKFVNEGAYVLKRVATGDGNDYTVKDNDYLVGADTNDSALTVTIPSSLIAKEGRVIIVNDEGGNAGTNAITIATEGSEDIDGSSSTTIGTNNGTLALYSDGSNLFSY